MKLGTYIHHMSGHCCKGFQGQGLKVKVMIRVRLNAMMVQVCRRSLISCFKI